jgi:hypothetical protein
VNVVGGQRGSAKAQNLWGAITAVWTSGDQPAFRNTQNLQALYAVIDFTDLDYHNRQAGEDYEQKFGHSPAPLDLWLPSAPHRTYVLEEGRKVLRDLNGYPSYSTLQHPSASTPLPVSPARCVSWLLKALSGSRPKSPISSLTILHPHSLPEAAH